MIHKSLLFGLVVLLSAGMAQVRADSDHSKVIQGGGPGLARELIVSGRLGSANQPLGLS